MDYILSDLIAMRDNYSETWTSFTKADYFFECYEDITNSHFHALESRYPDVLSKFVDLLSCSYMNRMDDVRACLMNDDYESDSTELVPSESERIEFDSLITELFICITSFYALYISESVDI